MNRSAGCWLEMSGRSQMKLPFITCRAGRLLPSSSWYCASSLRIGVDTWRRMFETRRHTLPVVETDRVVETKRKTILETTVQRQLQRVIRAPTGVGAQIDRAQALERPGRSGFVDTSEAAPGVGFAAAVGSCVDGRNAAPMSIALMFRVSIVS